MNLTSGRASVDDAGTVTITWENAAPPDHPDPVAWRATHTVSLVLPGTATVEPIEAPEQHDLEG